MCGSGLALTMRFGSHVAGREPADDDVECPLRLCRADRGDVRVTQAFVGQGVDGDVSAMTGKHRRRAAWTRLDDRRGGRVQSGGIGGRQGEGAQVLWVVEPAGNHPAHVDEQVLAAHGVQRLVAATRGATKVPRTGREPSGSS